jgi:hypothetical protein
MLHAGVAAGSVADLCQAGRSLSLEQVLEIALS